MCEPYWDTVVYLNTALVITIKKKKKKQGGSLMKSLRMHPDRGCIHICEERIQLTTGLSCVEEGGNTCFSRVTAQQSTLPVYVALSLQEGNKALTFWEVSSTKQTHAARRKLYCALIFISIVILFL